MVLGFGYKCVLNEEEEWVYKLEAEPEGMIEKTL